MISYDIIFWFVVWSMVFMIFHSVGNFIIPTDEIIFFRGVGQPPTRYNIVIYIYIEYDIMVLLLPLHGDNIYDKNYS